MSGGVFHRKLGYDYPIVDHGQGVYLYDTQGRRYLDASGGALVVNAGHGVPEIVEALTEQVGRVAFAHGTQFSSQALEEYGVALGEIAPLPDARAYLVSGGSEAVETALKLARQVCLARGEPGRYKIIARWGSYHGATLGALSVTGRVSVRQPYEPMLADQPHIPAAYCYRCPLDQSYPACVVACAEALEEEIQRQGPETIAAFIAEPVVGATLAAVPPPPEYWPRIRAICDQYGVLLIADEVMTGFGRTGRWFGVDHWGVRPDIVVTAKGASSGYWPLGAVLVQGELVDAIHSGPGNFTHGFSYANGVAGAAVGLAVLRYLQRHDLVSTSARQGALLLQELDALREFPAVGDVRGLGLMAGVELVADRETKTPFPRQDQVAERVQAVALARGLNFYIGTGMAEGGDGDAILIGPPFVITDAQIADIVDLLGRSIEEVIV